MKQPTLTRRHFPIYRPWDPARAQLAQSSQLPFDLVIQLMDHPQANLRISRCSAQSNAMVFCRDRSAQTPLDVEALTELIFRLQAQTASYQTQHQPNNYHPLPFICHLYAAPDPLSPAWLPTTLQLLRATRHLNVEWSIFIDGRFWDESDPKASQLVTAINDHQLNVIIYVDQYREDNQSVHYYTLNDERRMICRRSLLYKLAEVKKETNLTNICAAINPTYHNSTTLLHIFQEAVTAGAHPFIGCLDAYHYYRQYYQRNSDTTCPQHYNLGLIEGTSLKEIIDRIDEWSYFQKKPYESYQAPIFTRPVLHVNERNQLFIDPHLNMERAFVTDDKPIPLGEICGPNHLAIDQILQLFEQQVRKKS